MTELSDNARELTKLLAAECGTTQDIATLLKSLFAGTIEEMLEAEMAEHLGYSKHSIEGHPDKSEHSIIKLQGGSYDITIICKHYKVQK